MLRMSLLCVALALSLSSCAGLGALKLESISIGSPPSEVVKTAVYSGYFKVELSSSADIDKFLETSGKGPLYVSARLCPVMGEKDVRVIAFLPDPPSIAKRYAVYLA